ncbi:hypothetical protein CsSME_00026466 [Camellia sinensis var. sinensis]
MDPYYEQRLRDEVLYLHSLCSRKTKRRRRRSTREAKRANPTHPGSPTSNGPAKRPPRSPLRRVGPSSTSNWVGSSVCHRPKNKTDSQRLKPSKRP